MSRAQWPIPNDEELAAEIRAADSEEFKGRLERFRDLLREFGPPADMLLVGGIPALFALQEMKRSYILGNPLATILTAQAFIEHSLGGMYSLSGDDVLVRSGLAKLTERAAKDGAISADIARELDELREMRNPYTHPRAGMDPKGFMYRLRKAATYVPEELVDRDAKRAIEIVVDYLRHGSPTWTPQSKAE